MRPEDHDDGNDPDDREDGEEHRRRDFGLREGLRGLAAMLRALEEADGRRGIGRVEGARSSIDYDVTVGTGLGVRDGPERPRRPERRPGRDRSPRRSGRERRARAGEFHVSDREEDDEVVVVADLPGVPVEDLTVGFENDGETLVVAVGDEAVERVSLPWPGRAAWSSYNNGVLEVHLREDA